VKIPLFNFYLSQLSLVLGNGFFFFNFNFLKLIFFFWEVAYGGKQICGFHRRSLSHDVMNEMSI